MKDNNLKIGVEFDEDKLEKFAENMERVGEAMSDIVIKNNENVYLTINNWIEDKQKAELKINDEIEEER